MEKETKCPCLETCPINMVLKLLGGKWKLQIICALYNDGPTRFNTLKRKLDGVSNAALTNALKELEEDELITRIQYNEIPPHPIVFIRSNFASKLCLITHKAVDYI